MGSTDDQSKAISGETTLVAADKILVSSVGKELVMLDEMSDVYYGLNPVGRYVWKQLEEPVSVSRIERGVATRFDVSREDCRDDVRDFVVDLLDADLVERV